MTDFYEKAEEFMVVLRAMTEINTEQERALFEELEHIFLS